ncbi:unnamed protein product, partial [Heterotrigona itama]
EHGGKEVQKRKGLEEAGAACGKRKDGPDFEPRGIVCIPEIAQAPFQKL